MAVYTLVSAEEAAQLLARYDVGSLVALKGIAEGVENSNFLVETTGGRFFLTLYEKRVNPDDLPWFRHLLAHLHGAGCPVPRFIEDRDGNWLHDVAGRKACLIEFLPGISVSSPDAQLAHRIGAALGAMHKSLADFDAVRPNSLSLLSWRPLFEKCAAARIEEIAPGLAQQIAAELEFLELRWPSHLPVSAVHTDLFPDNVLTLNNQVSGLIDFYFACNDIRAYDLAVTHAAWCFSADGNFFDGQVSSALLAGYETAHGLSVDERAALPLLARGACLRFLLTRLFDWINTPSTALVTRKDPLAFFRRLEHYAAHGAQIFA